jgi:oxygen-independent coproporphyrinogen-3 oxidase
MYIGGGTPNTLSLKDLSDIITKVKEKVETQSLGIELLPSILTNEYLKGLVEIGFNKISLGIESMAKEVISNTQRLIAEDNKIIKLISESKKLKLFVNIDLMVGLANQTAESFLNDVKNLSIEKPSQITIYPYMMIGSNSNSSKMKESEQFQLIEKAWTILKAIGYKRSGIWTFTIEDDIYDSSRDELIEDYIGFGPAAFSTYDNYKVVNPELSVYLKNHNENKHYALISIKDKNTDIWRHFSRMLYDLEINNNIKLPFYMKTYLLILRICGFIKKNKLTNKGIMLSHNLTKTVVENLPYPLQNKHIIENNRDYLKALE